MKTKPVITRFPHNWRVEIEVPFRIRIPHLLKPRDLLPMLILLSVRVHRLTRLAEGYAYDLRLPATPDVTEKEIRKRCRQALDVYLMLGTTDSKPSHVFDVDRGDFPNGCSTSVAMITSQVWLRETDVLASLKKHFQKEARLYHDDLSILVSDSHRENHKFREERLRRIDRRLHLIEVLTESMSGNYRRVRQLIRQHKMLKV